MEFFRQKSTGLVGIKQNVSSDTYVKMSWVDEKYYNLTGKTDYVKTKDLEPYLTNYQKFEIERERILAEERRIDEQKKIKYDDIMSKLTRQEIEFVENYIMWQSVPRG